MSLPLEGSRDVHDGIIISLVPDICLTPAGGGMVPVPYTIWCRQADAANLANSVRQTDDRSHAVASIVQRCFGDEPGTGGGIFSGTTGAECTPKTWSPTVRAEGRNMVRHTDEWWMNHRNTFGRLLYTKDLAKYDLPSTQKIAAQMLPFAGASSNMEAALPQPTQLAQASVGIPLGAPEVPPLPPAMVEGTAQGIAGGINAAGTAIGNAEKNSLYYQLLLLAEIVRITQSNKKCPPCKTISGKTVAVGTLAYRHDVVPPAKPHFPFPGDHYNMYKANQYPAPKCDCFWQYVGTEDASGGKPPPAGSIPIEPFAR